MRASILTFGLIVTGIVVLVALAPWLNPCTGPIRFVDCVRWEESTVSNALAPWLFCPFGVCDYFPSKLTITLKFSVMAGIICAVGFLVSRLVSKRRALAGAGAAVATLISFVVLTGLVYSGPAA